MAAFLTSSCRERIPQSIPQSSYGNLDFTKRYSLDGLHKFSHNNIIPIGDLDPIPDGVTDFVLFSTDGEMSLVSSQTGDLLWTKAIDVFPYGATGFGKSGDVVGDLNNDGVDDFAVGAWLDDSSFTDAGAAHFYSGADGTLLYELFGGHAGEFFGWGIAGLGDTNGDGVADFAVSSPGFVDSNGLPMVGRVAIYSGLDQTVLSFINGRISMEQLGISVAKMDDTTGDGVNDVAIAGLLAPGLTDRIGWISINSGVDCSELSRDPYVGFGRHFQAFSDNVKLLSIGDVNSDGTPDLAVGLPVLGYDFRSGMLRVFSGVDMTELIYVAIAATRGLGESLATCPDVNGDGVPEIIVSARDLGGDPATPGAILVSGIDGVVLHNWRRTFAGYHFHSDAAWGNGLMVIDDMDGDGDRELVATSYEKDYPIQIVSF